MTSRDLSEGHVLIVNAYFLYCLCEDHERLAKFTAKYIKTVSTLCSAVSV